MIPLDDQHRINVWCEHGLYNGKVYPFTMVVYEKDCRYMKSGWRYTKCILKEDGSGDYDTITELDITHVIDHDRCHDMHHTSQEVPPTT